MRVNRRTWIKGAVIGVLIGVVFLVTMALSESPPRKITIAGGQIESSYDRASRDLAGLVRQDALERLAKLSVTDGPKAGSIAHDG
jgi:hypothetical protein